MSSTAFLPRNLIFDSRSFALMCQNWQEDFDHRWKLRSSLLLVEWLHDAAAKARDSTEILWFQP